MLHGLLEILKAWALSVAVLGRGAVAVGGRLAVGLRPVLLHYGDRGRRFLALDAPVLAVALDLDLGDGEFRAGADAGLLQLVVQARSGEELVALAGLLDCVSVLLPVVGGHFAEISPRKY